MVKNIFDEALADMKSIRDLTETSVKQELMETLTPQIRQMIESQLLLSDVEEGNEEPTNHKKAPENNKNRQPTKKPLKEFQTINTSFGIGYGTDSGFDEPAIFVDEDKEKKQNGVLHFSSLGNTSNLYESICAELLQEVEDIKNSSIPSYKKIKNTLVKIQEVQKNLNSAKMNDQNKKIVESVLNDCFNQINNIGNIKESNKSNQKQEKNYIIELEEAIQENDDFWLTEDSEFDEPLISPDEENPEEEVLENKINKNWRNEMLRSNGRRNNQISENTILEIDDRDLMRALRESLEEDQHVDPEKAQTDGVEEQSMDEDPMYEEEALEEGWLEEEEMPSAEGGDMGGDMGMPSDDLSLPEEMPAETPLQTVLTGISSLDSLEDLEQAKAAIESAISMMSPEAEGGEGDMMAPSGDMAPSSAPMSTMESRFNYYKRLYMEAKTGSKEEQKYLNILREVASKMTPNQKRKLIAEGSNNKPTAKSTNTVHNSNMRQKLAESNLLNSKLLYTNRLLQNNNLTNRQKTKIIEKIDEAKSEREVRLVFESVEKLVSDNKTQSGYESRVIGSSSAPTRRSSAATLNENYETDRWAKLAGILK